MAGFCTHGVSQFFASIRSAEGRKDLFSLLVRFVLDDKGYGDEPLVIVYDVRSSVFPQPQPPAAANSNLPQFACQLESYCRSRAPYLFRNVRFVVDRLHRHGHTCSQVYDMDEFADLAKVNSQASEQCACLRAGCVPQIGV